MSFEKDFAFVSDIATRLSCRCATARQMLEVARLICGVAALRPAEIVRDDLKVGLAQLPPISACEPTADLQTATYAPASNASYVHVADAYPLTITRRKILRKRGQL